MTARHHNVYVDGAVCFWTSSIIDHVPVFRSRTACLRVMEILHECRLRYNIRLLGYVLMPEHVHLAVWSESAKDVQTFLREFLRRSSVCIAGLASSAAARGNSQAAAWLERFRERARQNARVRVWKECGRAFPVTKEDGLRQKLEYIHNNPVRKGLVDTPEDWEFSSAGFYAGKVGLIQIDELEC